MCKQKRWNKSLQLTYLILARSKRSQKKQLPCCKSPAGFGETENFRKSLEWCTKQHLITCSSNQAVNKWASFWHDRNTSILDQGKSARSTEWQNLSNKGLMLISALGNFSCLFCNHFLCLKDHLHPSQHRQCQAENLYNLLNRGLLKHTISSCQKWECKTGQFKWQMHTSVGHQWTLLLLLLQGFYQDLEKRNKPTNLGGTSASFPSHPLLTKLLLLPVFSCFAIPVHIMGSHVVP